MSKQRAAARLQQAHRNTGRPIAPITPIDLRPVQVARAVASGMTTSTLGRYLDGARRRHTDQENRRD